MKTIGLTYDLRDDYLAQGYSLEQIVEFDSEETILSVETSLKKQGFLPERIGNVKQLVARLVQGQRWDLVFNFAEGLHGRGREAQIPVLLEAYQIPYTFSDSVTLAVTLDKSLTKRIIRDHGIPTAPFKLIQSKDDLANFDLAFPVFAKPVAEGTSKGATPASLIRTPEELERVSLELLQRFQQPVLVENFLPGREFTVGILGTGNEARILGVLEIILLKDAEQQVYSLVNKENCEKYVEYRLVTDHEAKQAATNALTAWKALNCRDAGRVDLRSNAKGQPQFLEINPLSGLNPGHSDLPILASQVGMSYDELIASILRSASKRLPQPSKVNSSVVAA